MKLRMSYALNEGGTRDFAISTTHFSGSDGRVEQIHWTQNSGAPPFEPVPGTEESHPAELVLLAMGFLGPEQTLLEQLGVERDARSNADAPASGSRSRETRCSGPQTLMIATGRSRSLSTAAETPQRVCSSSPRQTL